MRMAYFAHPIDLVDTRMASSEMWVHIIEQVRSTLSRYADIVYSPGTAFVIGQDREVRPGDEIQELNRRALQQADAVVAIFIAGVPSFGVPAEVQEAVSMGKPVLLLTDRETWAMQNPAPNLMVRLLQDELKPSNPFTFIQHLDKKAAEYAVRHMDALKVQRITDTATLPTSAYSDDAGLDLYLDQDIAVETGHMYNVETGIQIELPPGTWAEVAGRSSSFYRLGIQVQRSVIDEGYRGPLFVCITKLDVHLPGCSGHEVVLDGLDRVVEERGCFQPNTIHLKRGERIAQLIIHRNTTQQYKVVEVDSLTPSRRGANGFGSSGK